MSVFRISYASEALCRYVNLTVIIPFESPGMPQLQESKPEKFRTLYLLHGFGGCQDDWMDYTQIRNIAEQYNLAVVLPSGENSFYVDTDIFAARYGTFIGKEIVDYTRRVFPLSKKREDTFIGGMSMGGFGAVRLGCFYYENFSKVFSFSGAFITDDIVGQKSGYRDLIADYDYYKRTFGNLDTLKGSEKDPIWCLDRAISAGQQPNLYLACGEEDFLLEENRNMKEKLENRDVKFEYHESPGNNNWIFWNEYLEEAIKWAIDTE